MSFFAIFPRAWGDSNVSSDSTFCLDHMITQHGSSLFSTKADPVWPQFMTWTRAGRAWAFAEGTLHVFRRVRRLRLVESQGCAAAVERGLGVLAQARLGGRGRGRLALWASAP